MLRRIKNSKAGDCSPAFCALIYIYLSFWILTNVPNGVIIYNVRRETDRKAVDTMKHDDRMNEVTNMTNRQAAGLLEALKIIAEKAETKEEVIEAIGRIQDKMKEPTPTTK